MAELRNLDDYNNRVREYFENAQRLYEERKRLEASQRRRRSALDNPNGIACPKCGSELGDIDGFSFGGGLEGHPKFAIGSQFVHCAQCGFDGFRVASVQYFDGKSFHPVPKDDLERSGLIPERETGAAQVGED